MKIGIDARLVNGPRRGMGNVLYNILLYLRNYYTGDIVLYFDRNLDNDLKNIFKQLNYKIEIIDNKNYLIWEQFLLPIRIRRDKIDLFWHPYNTGSIYTNCLQIVSIHDVMYMKSKKVLPYSKNLYQIFGRLYRKSITPIIARKAKYIITISNSAKEDIIKEIKGVSKKIYVVYNGCNKSIKKNKNVSEWEQFKKEHNIKDKYLFCLGASDPRKNTIYTIEAFNKFIKKNDLDIQLVVCGLKDWKDSNAYYKVKDLGISDKVIFLDYVSDEILDFLYTNAYIFLFLSFYEGFGLPILEAMSLNTPVITTNVTSMPEIAGDAAILTSYNDIDKTVEDLENLFFNNNLYNQLLLKGQNRVKLFTWEKAAEKIANIIKIIEDDIE